MCSTDLVDAYYLVPIHRSSQQFLKVEFFGKLYQFTCLPFGPNVNPFVFTKLLKPVKSFDAYTKWTTLVFYVFPPFSLILKVLIKSKQDKAVGVVVVPVWPSQSWFPLFLELLVDKPLVFRPNNNMLISSCRMIRHPQASHLRLMVGKISWKAS